MPIYTSMLRGINVGGHKRVKMDALRKSFETLGFESVKTYIQSGNVVFKAGKVAPTALSKKIEERISELKAKGQATKEQAQLDLSRKEAEVFASTYSEIRRMAEGVAKQRGINMVVQASAAEVTASNPKSIEAALFRTVIYSDSKVDLSNDVIHWLNYYYKKSGGPAPKGRDASGAPAAAPASANAGAAAPR